MKLPKRADTHVMETKSVRIMHSLAPDDWILRDVSERDYGIDFYIELSNKADEITGDLLSIQLKSEEKIEWRTDNTGKEVARSPSINVTTANYWMKLPVPVLLFVADLSASEIYIVSVKNNIRNQYKKLSTQDTVSFPLDRRVSLRSDIGKIMVRAFYLRERAHPTFEGHLTTLLSNIETHSEFILGNQMRDCFLEVESSRHLEFRALYNACGTVANYLGMDWDIPRLIDVYREDHTNWKDVFCLLHEGSLDKVLSKIEKIYPKIIKEALEIVTGSQKDYWSTTNSLFYSLCSDGELQLRCEHIKERFGRG